MNQSDLG